MFDPYYKWLGIPPKDQPPNYYRLFSLELYEKDLDVIEGAADRVMGFLRQYQSGENASAAAKLLNEVATARLCLLKPASKAEYDAKLKSELVAKEAPKDEPPAFVMDDEVEQLVRTSKPAPKPVSKPAPKKKKKSSSQVPMEYVLAGGAGVLILLPVLIFFGPSWGNSPQPSKPPQVTANPPAPAPAAPSSAPDASAAVAPVLKPVTTPAPQKSPTTAIGSRPPRIPSAVPEDAVGPAVDLLNGVDLKRDQFAGKWTVEDSSFVGGEWSKLYLPGKLPEDYQLHFSIKRTVGTDCIFLGFIMSGRQGMVALDLEQSKHWGLCLGSGGNSFGNTTSRMGALFKSDQISHVVLTIHPGHLTVTFDGRQIIEWFGGASRLNITSKSNWGMPNCETAFVATGGSTFEIHAAAMIPIRPEPSQDRAERLEVETNLSEILNLDRDKFSGTWRLENQELHSPEFQGSHAIYAMPVEVPEEYSLSMNVELAQDSKHQPDAFIGLVAGETPFQVPLQGGDEGTGIEKIDGIHWTKHAPKMRGPHLTRGKPSKVVCTVTKQRISLEIDGRLCFNWTGYQRRLSPNEEWLITGRRKLFLMTISHFKFSDIKIGPPVELPVVQKLTNQGTRRAVDLLPMIDPKRDAFKGTWTLDKSILRAMGDSAQNKLVLNCEVPKEYQLKFRLAHEKGGVHETDLFSLSVPMGSDTANVMIDAAGSNFSGVLLDKMEASDEHNPTFHKGQLLPTGQEKSFELTVRKNRLRLAQGNKEIFNWRGNPARLWTGVEWSVPQGRIAIGSWAARTRIERLELQPLESDDNAFPPVSELDGEGNLIKVIDPARDSRLGDWKIQQGALICPAHELARLRVPTPLPQAYSLSAIVERTSGNRALFLGLVVDGNPCAAMIDAEHSTATGLSLVDGKTVGDNWNFTRRLYKGSLLSIGQSVPVKCLVLPDTIIVNCGGKEIIRWHGDPRRLSSDISWIPPNYSEEDESHLWLGGFQSGFVIRDLKLRSLSDDEVAQIKESLSTVWPLTNQSDVPFAEATILPK